MPNDQRQEIRQLRFATLRRGAHGASGDGGGGGGGGSGGARAGGVGAAGVGGEVLGRAGRHMRAWVWRAVVSCWRWGGRSHSGGGRRRGGKDPPTRLPSHGKMGEGRQGWRGVGVGRSWGESAAAR